MRHLTLLLLCTLLTACVDVPARPLDQTADTGVFGADPAVDAIEDTDLFESDTAVEDTIIQSGHYYFVGKTNRPLPTVLRLVIQIIALDDGRVAIAGGEAKPKEGVPQDTTDVDEVTIDTTNDGFTIFGVGTFNTDINGDRSIQIEPLRLDTFEAGLRITYNSWTLRGKVIKDQNGNDSIDGTMSFSDGAIYIDENPTPFARGSARIAGTFVLPARVPPGGPDLCGDLCKTLVQCDPPANFPDPDFCSKK